MTKLNESLEKVEKVVVTTASWLRFIFLHKILFTSAVRTTLQTETASNGAFWLQSQHRKPTDTSVNKQKIYEKLKLSRKIQNSINKDVKNTTRKYGNKSSPQRWCKCYLTHGWRRRCTYVVARMAKLVIVLVVVVSGVVAAVPHNTYRYFCCLIDTKGKLLLLLL